MKTKALGYFFIFIATANTVYTKNNELNAFEEQEIPTEQNETSPEHTSVDRSQLSVNELLKEIQYFNDYMSHLYKKQQQRAVMHEAQQKEQHIEEIQQLELISQKMDLILHNSSNTQESFILHTSTIKTLQLTLDKITSSYEAGILSISTFERVSKLLQKIITLLENHIHEASKQLNSIEAIKNITSSIKDYESCKKIIDRFHVSYQTELQDFITRFSSQLDINSTTIQKIITYELKEIQLLKQKQSIISQQLHALKMRSIKENIKHLKNIHIEPFSFIKDCLQKIAQQNTTSSTYQDQQQLITKLEKHTISIAEINRAIQYINKFLQTKNDYEQTKLYTVFENDNIEELQTDFQTAVTIITRNYNALQKVLITTTSLEEYQQMQHSFLATATIILEKEKILEELKKIIQELRDYLDSL